MISFSERSYATVILNPSGDGGFETGNTFAANNWSTALDANNKWYVGTAAKCNGLNGAYIDVLASNGAGNTYLKNKTRVSHFYRDFSVPAGQNSITLSFNYRGQGESTWDYMRVYVVSTSVTPVAGTLLGTGQVGNTYYNLTSTCTNSVINLPPSLAGTTRRLVFTWRNDNTFGSDPAMMVDDISIVSTIATAPLNDDPCNAAVLNVNSTCNFITYSNALATNSSGVSVPSCGNYQGGDIWFKVTVPSSGLVVFNSNVGVMTDGAMAVYTGTCSGLTEIGCDDDGGNGTMPSLTISGQLPGSILFVRFWESGNDNNGTFQLCASTFIPVANDNPCNAIVLPVNGSCTFNTYTNAGATNTPGIPAPTCSNYQGGDVWFTATIPLSGLLNFDSNTGTITDGGMAVYKGSCNSLIQVDCNDDQSVNGLMPFITISSLAPGTQVWIRFWEYGNDNNGTFQLCAYNPCNAGSPVNDNCLNAVPLFLGVPVTGTNTCSTNSGEPSPPACWITPNVINSVWYSVKSPLSGQIRIKVLPNTLLNPQIAMYSGSCGTGMTLIGCNDDGSPCGSTPNPGSDLKVSGLTNGTVYYIRVDGYSSAVGVFGILAIDGSLSLPNLSNGQDCGTYLPVCDTSISFGNPGFQSFGNICDFPGSNSFSRAKEVLYGLKFLLISQASLNFQLFQMTGRELPVLMELIMILLSGKLQELEL